MSSSANFEWFCVGASAVLLDWCVKASFFLAVITIAALLVRNASASVRHRLWCLGFCGSILLPLFSMLLPQWRVPLLPALPVVVDAPRSGHDASAGENTTNCASCALHRSKLAGIRN